MSRAAAMEKALQAVTNYGSSWLQGLIQESYPGAFQQNVTVGSSRSIIAFSPVYACVTAIASDIAKMEVGVIREDEENGICVEVKNHYALSVLKTPNRYQNRIKFVENWIISKLLYGNTYVLKQYGPGRKVAKLYILDAQRVTPLVADDGGVYYQLSADKLAGLEETITVPASEIIHDRMECLFHPLVGISPIFACGVTATMGNKIQNNSTKFFDNMSRPSGMLTAPTSITNEVAARLKAHWESNFSGSNIGRLAVLGDGLKYDPMTIPAQEAQLIEQLRWTIEDAARCFHMPLFKVGGPVPVGSTIDALTQMYYSDCLQSLIESLELTLGEGLELQDGYYIQCDLDGLLRMDQLARITSLKEAVQGSLLSPNEGRRSLNKPKVDGGENPLAQQQNFSLAALARRDSPKTEGISDVQATAMNGAQVTSLQGIISSVAAGEIPPDSARAILAAAFPLLTDAQLDAIINPLKNFEQDLPEPPAPAATPEPAPAAPPAKEETQIDFKLMADLLEKELPCPA